MMREDNEKFPILVVMLTYIIILIMYIFTYAQKSYIFWLFFVIERLLSFFYETEIDSYLSSVEIGHLKGGHIVVVTLFSLLGVGIFLYTPFKYPYLFMILIIGEAMDKIGQIIKQRFFKINH